MSDYDPLTLPAAYFEGLPTGVPNNLPSQPEPVPDELTRLRTENEFLRTALQSIATTVLSRDGSADLCYCRWFVGVAKQALKYASPAGGTRQ